MIEQLLFTEWRIEPPWVTEWNDDIYATWFDPRRRVGRIVRALPRGACYLANGTECGVLTTFPEEGPVSPAVSDPQSA